MAYEYLTMVTSFIMFFMIGVILSIHPASIIVGEHTKLSHLSRWTRWNGYLIFILTMFIVDVLITNGLYAVFYDVYGNLSVLRELAIDPMAIFFSESFQIGVVIVFVLVLLQVLGLVDLAHGERNLSFHYDQLHQGKEQPSWMEQYMAHEKGGLGLAIVGLIYMLRMTMRTMWPYIICLIWFKLIAMLANVLLSPVINRLMHVETMTSTHIILDPYVAIYVIAGFLWGYVALHYDIDKAYNVANSTVIAIVPRLTVILGAVIFIGLALAIIMVPITWDVVVDTLTKL
ncbi:hypothetical protein [uncultured Veillonella sp.]|uniref:hypothetical protein n=3 Tax=uncultured Veillonella sp. TaxID=159268 RepID=UPI002634AE16|nr:hypothetical protein [uncultured Veillonella sp.]